MRTQFSTEEFGPDAKIARRSDVNAELEGERTWLTKLNALYSNLIASEKPEEVAANALELAEACMDLEQQAAKHPDTLSPALVVVVEPRMPVDTIAVVSATDAVVLRVKAPNIERVADFTDSQDGAGDDEDEDAETPEDYDGPTCPHGIPEHLAILGKCALCRKAESTYDDDYADEEIGIDDLGSVGD